jgi:hypothetical protein
MTWEEKILRKVYRSKCEQGAWRIRSNLELQNAYKSLDIVTKIKIIKLEWLGNFVRMQDTCIPKMVKPLGIKRWRLKAQDRKEWTIILREAKPKLKE